MPDETHHQDQGTLNNEMAKYVEKNRNFLFVFFRGNCSIRKRNVSIVMSMTYTVTTTKTTYHHCFTSRIYIYV